MRAIYLNVTARECTDLVKASYARVCGPGCMDYEEREWRRVLGDSTYDLVQAYKTRSYDVRLTPWPMRSNGLPPFKKRFSDTDERPWRRRFAIT